MLGIDEKKSETSARTRGDDAIEEDWSCCGGGTVGGSVDVVGLRRRRTGRFGRYVCGWNVGKLICSLKKK